MARGNGLPWVVWTILLGVEWIMGSQPPFWILYLETLVARPEVFLVLGRSESFPLLTEGLWWLNESKKRDTITFVLQIWRAGHTCYMHVDNLWSRGENLQFQEPSWQQAGEGMLVGFLAMTWPSITVERSSQGIWAAPRANNDIARITSTQISTCSQNQSPLMWDQKNVLSKTNLLTLRSKGQPPNAGQFEFVFSGIHLPGETSEVPAVQKNQARGRISFPSDSYSFRKCLSLLK